MCDDYEDVMILDNGNEYVTCWQCGGDGVSDHDCGEDCCNCLWPEDNVRCDICGGNGGWERVPDWKKSSTGPGGSNG
jgi:hypothetical protein